MKKIEISMLQAINNGQARKLGNTTVSQSVHNPNNWQVTLHNSEIASFCSESNSIEFSFCGWATVTTRSRLNAILQSFFCGRLYQKDWDQFLVNYNGTHELSCRETYRVSLETGKVQKSNPYKRTEYGFCPRNCNRDNSRNSQYWQDLAIAA